MQRPAAKNHAELKEYCGRVWVRIEYVRGVMDTTRRPTESSRLDQWESRETEPSTKELAGAKTRPYTNL